VLPKIIAKIIFSNRFPKHHIPKHSLIPFVSQTVLAQSPQVEPMLVWLLKQKV